MFSFLVKKTKSKAAFSKAEILKKPVAVFAGLVLFLLTGPVFVSCPDGDTGKSTADPEKLYVTAPMPENLKGTWISSFGEEYIISDTGFSSGMPPYGGYKGTIVEHRENKSGAGYITIQYTENDWNPDAVGKFYVIHYKNLTSSSVSIAGSSGSGESTRAEAEAAYTVTGGYFASYSDCEKYDPEAAYLTTDMPEELIGTWKEPWSTLTISETEFFSGTDWGGYKGTIVGHRSNGSDAGYITIQFTEHDDNDTVGKYYVIHYEDLTSTTMAYSGAYNGDDPDFEWPKGGGKATQVEAESAYTVTAGYFGIHTEVTKTPGGGDSFPNAVEGEYESWWGDEFLTVTDQTITFAVDAFGSKVTVFTGTIEKPEDSITPPTNFNAAGYIVFKYDTDTVFGDETEGTYSVLYWREGGPCDDPGDVHFGIVGTTDWEDFEPGEASAEAAENEFLNNKSDYWEHFTLFSPVS